MSAPAMARLADGRLHMQHGPIDLILGAEGPGAEAALLAAATRFATVLTELVAELPRLRAADGPEPQGAVARRMVAAIAPHAAADFVTPMAAVAGAVADEVLAAMRAAGTLERAYVNNGGDIALHLRGDARFEIALGRQDGRQDGRTDGALSLDARGGVGGVATSGRGGRSLSLGIADAVTVLAGDAAQADAAATLIANAVDLPDHPAIRRLPANFLRDDSDLGARPAVASVGPLAQAEIDAALARGAARAEAMRRAGLILGAALRLRGAARLVGTARMREVVHA